MPAKSMCPNCGQKWRSPAHICHPTRLDKVARRKAALAAATQLTSRK